MSQEDIKTLDQLSLPPSVVSKIDVSRLISEVERLDSELAAIAIRERAGVATQLQPVVSSQLSDFLLVNQLDLNDSHRRGELIQQLRQLKNSAPVIHMTFAAVADTESLQKLVAWLRQSVNPQALIFVGLQPNLIGGVYLRTSNRVHDLSVRSQLAGHRHLLVKEMEALSGKL